LSNQICTDDKADTVRRHLDQFTRSHQQGGWLNRTLARIFH
jgi:hemerythrin